jgi:hypothetical protein
MAIGGPGRTAQGYGGGSGGQMYQQSGSDQQKKKNMNLFDNAAANKPSFKKSTAATGMIDGKMSDAAVITDIEELLVKPHHGLSDQEVALLEDFPETISEQEMITLNYSEFSDDEDASTSGDKTRYINMIVNNYLKHITVFCVLVVAVSVCTFFILSYINGF